MPEFCLFVCLLFGKVTVLHSCSTKRLKVPGHFMILKWTGRGFMNGWIGFKFLSSSVCDSCWPEDLECVTLCYKCATYLTYFHHRFAEVTERFDRNIINTNEFHYVIYKVKVKDDLSTVHCCFGGTHSGQTSCSWQSAWGPRQSNLSHCKSAVLVGAATSIIFSRQKYACILSRQNYVCRDNRVFVATNVLSRQKLYLWQPPPMIPEKLKNCSSWNDHRVWNDQS